jgi:hypothetical protein
MPDLIELQRELHDHKEVRMGAYDNDMGGGGSASYLRVKLGETIRIRICSDPFFFDDTFTVKGETKTVKRVAWIVLNKTKEDGKPVVLPTTFKTGPAVYGAIRDLAKNEEWGNPTGYDITITCNGGDVPNKYYSVAPCPNGKPITEEQQALLDEADFDLEAMYCKKSAEHATSATVDPFED